MPPFPKPTFAYDYSLQDEIAALHSYQTQAPGRDIPDKDPSRLLVVTWNVANLGVQERRDQDHAVIAEILSWFDFAALQEVNDNLEGLRGLQAHLPDNYRLVFSDSGGNNERLTFVYDADKLALHEEVGEVNFPPSEYRFVKLPGVIEHVFTGFDRNPYLATFSAGSFSFTPVNCHSYFGGEDKASMDRRTLETYAIARWTDLRRGSKYSFTKDIVVLGDMNLPKVEVGDPIYDALTARGLHIPEHSTQIGSSIASDNHYDQVAFFVGETQDDFVQAGVFDFDGALFKELWESRPRDDFLAYMRYYVSDHRPLWSEFKLS